MAKQFLPLYRLKTGGTVYAAVSLMLPKTFGRPCIIFYKCTWLNEQPGKAAAGLAFFKARFNPRQKKKLLVKFKGAAYKTVKIVRKTGFVMVQVYAGVLVIKVELPGQV